MSPYEFGSIFSGIGGLDLGFERQGFTCRWQIEIDDYARSILEKNFPNAKKHKDIRRCGQALEPVPGVIGGWPCQDISVAGSGRGLAGSHSGLFFEALRVVQQVRAEWLVLENVAGLLVRDMGRVCASLAEVGFDLEWHCIQAADVGAPHIRDRVFIFGVRRCQNAQIQPRRSPPSPEVLAYSNREGLEKWKGSKEASRASTTIARGDWWDAEPDVDRMAHGVPNRVDRVRCLGNAVVPQVAEELARIVRSRISREG